MDRFRSLEIFAKTAERLNFAEAARELKMTRAMVSKHIGELETHLGVRLFQRTTRSVGLTEAGRALAAKADTVIETLKEAEDSVRDLHTVLRGRLRINAPVSFGVQHLGPLVAQFLRDHPGVEVDLTLNDRTVDLIEEGYDLVIRIGVLTDSSLIARRLAPARLVIVGSKDYLQRNDMPKRPADLKRHNCLGYTYWSLRDEWPITNADGDVERVKVKGSLTANNGDALRLAAIEGLGLILQPSFSVGTDIAAGRLVHVLPDCTPRELSVYAVYAPGHPPTAKLRSFIDMLAKAWGDAPPWDTWMKRM
ncbi:MAG: LysR family transcriptional regulator [Micropepsaceae bacterium]